jgi:hypothetical protein
LVSLILATAWILGPALRAQTSASSTGTTRGQWNNTVPTNKAAYAGKQSEPAPKRDISGIWDGSAEGGFQAKGAAEHPAMRANDLHEGIDTDERNIAKPLPYTALGEETLEAHKPAAGVRSVAAALVNDPTNICDPVGFPRMELFEMRTFELAQTDDQIIYLNQYNDNWRVIWTDGRELPKDPEPRWNGYSVGKWIDDYTFVAETVGTDDRTWLDNSGRPHSSDLHVEERFHRASDDILELTVTIDDPQMYTKPWVAIDKIPLHRQPKGFDMREMTCAPSETLDYNSQIGTRTATGGDWKGR